MGEFTITQRLQLTISPSANSHLEYNSNILSLN